MRDSPVHEILEFQLSQKSGVRMNEEGRGQTIDSCGIYLCESDELSADGISSLSDSDRVLKLRGVGVYVKCGLMGTQ